MLQSNSEALSQHIVNNVRKVFILLILIIFSVSLFYFGFSMGYSSLMAKLAAQDGAPVTVPLWGGFGLCLLTLIVLSQLLSEKNWLKATGIAPSSPMLTSSGSSLPNFVG